VSRKYRYLYEIYIPVDDEIVETCSTLKECKLQFVKWSLLFGGHTTFQYRKVKVRTFVNEI